MLTFLQTSVTLEEIESVNGFIGRLEKIELPNQLVAVLEDPLLQKLLQLKSTDATRRRIDYWLMAFFEDQLEADEQSEETVLQMLASVREYAKFAKVLPPACAKYIHSLLGDWNGFAGRGEILDLLSYTPIAPFEGIYTLLPVIIAYSQSQISIPQSLKLLNGPFSIIPPSPKSTSLHSTPPSSATGLSRCYPAHNLLSLTLPSPPSPGMPTLSPRRFSRVARTNRSAPTTPYSPSTRPRPS